MRKRHGVKRMRLTTTGKNGPTSKRPYRFGPQPSKEEIRTAKLAEERQVQIYNKLLREHDNNDQSQSNPAPEPA